MNQNRTICILVVLLFAGCSNSQPVYNEEYSSLEPKDLVAFVGRKISVTEFEPENEEGLIILDLAFLAEYQVLQQFSGEKLPSKVKFEAYEHYGTPDFSKHDIALLYLFQDENNYYHVKYIYDQVIQSENDQWFTCGTKNYLGKNLLEPTRVSNNPKCINGNRAIDMVNARKTAGVFN